MEPGSRSSLFAPQGSSPLKRVFFSGFLNRRKFLKYAGATGAVVGASALGLNYISKQSPSSATPTTSTTTTRQLTTTSSVSNTSTQTTQLASLQGRLFFDYNGNGKQDGEEPAVAGALVQLKDSAGKVIAESVTDSSGDYKLEDVKAGSYKLHIEAEKKFRYMCGSPDEFRAMIEDYKVSGEGTMSLNIGLMEGFLTLPFERKTAFEVGSYYDHAVGAGAENWKGNALSVGDEHLGTDFKVAPRTAVLATVPETVTKIWFKEGKEGGFIVETFIKKSENVEFNNSYGHLQEVHVEEGKLLGRGEVIGISGSWGNYPHVHWAFLRFTRDDEGLPHPIPGERDIVVDPWAYIKRRDSESYWTVFNYPQFLS
jgi:murein DD-endopeptidase MepM/ murein hydrolase activator NlpD